MEIILIRHGETEANIINNRKSKIFIGQAEYQLSENGIKQALKLKDNPLLDNVDYYCVSPSLRTKQTFSLITSNNNNVIYDVRLLERSLGLFENHYVDEIKDIEEYKRYFLDDYKDFAHSFDKKAPSGESYLDVCDRLTSFLNDLKQANHQKVVIVTHFCVIRCLLFITGYVNSETIFSQKVYPCTPITINI